MAHQNTPLLKASIGKTAFKCGKLHCTCIKGPPHSAYYLSYRKEGKTHTVHIPKELVKTVSAGCRNWKAALKKLESSTHQWVQSQLQAYRNRKKDKS